MCAWRRMAAMICAWGWLTICGGNVEAAPADPEFGRVSDGTYTNDYFRMSFPLPPGWREDLEGPGPSHTGYYVLSALRGPGDRGGTILIAAQDQFFGVKGSQGAAEAARAFIENTGAKVICLAWLKTIKRDYHAFSKRPKLQPYQVNKLTSAPLRNTHSFSGHIRNQEATADIGQVFSRYYNWNWPIIE